MAREVVADASVVVKALTDETAYAAELKQRLRRVGVHTPHLLEPEVGDTMRKMVLLGHLDSDVALTALLSVNGIVDERYPHAPLTRLAWELRDRVRFYDAMYVALAARLDMPLLTADKRLSRAHRLPCAVEVV